jgi:HK97 gp10 family phage protein
VIGDVIGLGELLRRLDNVPLVLSRNVARDALAEAGEVMKAALESTAPVRTGELRESIGVAVHISGDFSKNYVSVGPERDAGTAVTRKRGRYAGGQDLSTLPAVYARFVEYGHGPPGSAQERRRLKRSGKEIEYGSGSTPPRPFMRQAFDASVDEATEVLRSHTAEALERIEPLL